MRKTLGLLSNLQHSIYEMSGENGGHGDRVWNHLASYLGLEDHTADFSDITALPFMPTQDAPRSKDAIELDTTKLDATMNEETKKMRKVRIEIIKPSVTGN